MSISTINLWFAPLSPVCTLGKTGDDSMLSQEKILILIMPCYTDHVMTANKYAVYCTCMLLCVGPAGSELIKHHCIYAVECIFTLYTF